MNLIIKKLRLLVSIVSENRGEKIGMKKFLHKKNIKFSVKRYGIQALGAMAKGLFASLIVGLILKVIGQQLGISLLVEFSKTAQDMMGPAIGVAVAYGLEAPPLVIFTSVVTGGAGAQLGGPVGLSLEKQFLKKLNLILY